MSIYIDELTDYGYKGRWSHMMTDGNIEELHSFAKRIGLKREWFQDNKTSPHYDLMESKRKSAIKLGAIEISSREMVLKCSKLFRNKE